MIGNFPEWRSVRPISAAQVSGKNELDKHNGIFLGFFTAKYKNEYRLCFRNGGLFRGRSYFCFVEIKKGISRAHSEVIFVKNSIYLRSYTNKNNTLQTVLHMSWEAKLQHTSAQNAIHLFQFPKKELVKDFSTTFDGAAESIYFASGLDPYKEANHPYLSKTNVSFTLASNLTPNPNKNVFLVITSQPLMNGITYIPQNLKYQNRYVQVKASENSFTFNYMHPGTYYLYALYDNDGNGSIGNGDWMNATTTPFTLNPHTEFNITTNINFIIF